MNVVKRRFSAAAAAAFSLASFGAFGGSASATPAYERPQPWELQALDTLAVDGLVPGYPDENLNGDAPITRAQMAALVAKLVAKLEVDGVAKTSRGDVAVARKLVDDYADELTLLGVRVATADKLLVPDLFSKYDRRPTVHGRLAADDSFRQEGTVSKTIAGGNVDPFVNAFLTSPASNDPFEHDPGRGNHLRFDAKFDPSFDLGDNVTLAVPVRVMQYDAPLSQQDGYTVAPAAVLDIGKFGPVRDAYLRVGQLDNLESSRLGLTYRAPDETQQGPGFQNAVQPYETGVDAGGNLGPDTQIQIAYAQIDQSMIGTFPGFGDTAASNNYFLVGVPPAYSNVQFGTHANQAAASRTETLVVSNATVSTFYLRAKAAIGSVFVSEVNGMTCTATGVAGNGGPCPILPSSYYFIESTNQVVFKTPLPVGTTLQVSYATGGAGGTVSGANVQYTRNHFNVRINQHVAALPGAEVGLSVSRIVDSKGTGDSDGVLARSGYGAESDTVYGMDARIPLSFIPIGKDRSALPIFFAEGAFSKFTPNLATTPAVTDSALAMGLRIKVARARATVQYQAVGPDFLDGGVLRFLGPPPATYAYYRNFYFPQFFGFANNVAVNQIFSNAVTPGCSGTACATANPLNTYIYPVFNPFQASGPQFYSAFAPNSRGLTAHVTVPIGRRDSDDGFRFKYAHVREVQPNGNGSQEYGPGFSTSTPLKFDTYEAGLRFGIPVAGRRASFDLAGSVEHLFRLDRTAYSYIPFNTASGGPDAGAAVALNAYLAGGTTPVLFYPNYVDERHITVTPTLRVPVARDLEFAVTSSLQSFGGANATTAGRNISERKSDTLATLGYAIPHSNTTIHVLFGNQTYSDAVVPSYNFSQNREAVDLTARF